MTNKIENLILGAGIAGLGASYALRQKGQKSVVVEKDNTYGGLCSNFEIDGFRFDRFVHLSFSKINQVNEIFNRSCPNVYRLIPNPFNLYKGIWIKHPAQNNLYPLPEKEKQLIVEDFRKRPSVDECAPQNYEEWLRLQFGDYFAEHFPMVYTRKYWRKEARKLRTEWVGKRVYQPSLDEVIEGCKTLNTPITYYAKEMRYPVWGGYKSYLKELVHGADIRYGMEVSNVDVFQKTVSFANGVTINYDKLISSIPLIELVRKSNAPDEIARTAKLLEHTSGYHISVGFKTKQIPPYLWWYIYDEDILASRVYSPSLKSPDNAPEGCSSLQFEVSCKEDEYSESELIEGTIGKIVKQGIVKEDDILFAKVGFEKYANIVFTEPIYRARKLIRDYFRSREIETVGRFGEWDYLWSDQALMSGLNID